MENVNDSRIEMTIQHNESGACFLICGCGFFREFPFMYALNSLSAADKHSMKYHNKQTTLSVQHRETQ